MRRDPDQLLLDGRRLADARAATRAADARARLDAWASHVEPGITVAELAARWWPHLGDPRGWRHGSYPRTWLRASWHRVRRLERAGMVVLELGPLRHRSQAGTTVRPVASRQVGRVG